jgi:hypothetical protein
MRSYNQNFDSLKDLLGCCKGAMVIALQETWKLDYAKDMPGYQKIISLYTYSKRGK